MGDAVVLRARQHLPSAIIQPPFLPVTGCCVGRYIGIFQGFWIVFESSGSVIRTSGYLQETASPESVTIPTCLIAVAQIAHTVPINMIGHFLRITCIRLCRFDGPEPSGKDHMQPFG